MWGSLNHLKLFEGIITEGFQEKLQTIPSTVRGERRAVIASEDTMSQDTSRTEVLEVLKYIYFTLIPPPPQTPRDVESCILMSIAPWHFCSVIPSYMIMFSGYGGRGGYGGGGGRGGGRGGYEGGRGR